MASIGAVATPQKKTFKTKFIEFINDLNKVNATNRSKELVCELKDYEQEEANFGLDTDSRSICSVETNTAELRAKNTSLNEKITCGLVNIDRDSGGQYTLQCLFCTTEFPIHQWIEFCKHLTAKHSNFKKKYITTNTNSRHNEIKNCPDANLNTSKCEEFSISKEIKNHLGGYFKSSLSGKDSIVTSPAFQCTEIAPEILSTIDLKGKQLATMQPDVVHHLETKTDENELQTSHVEIEDTEHLPLLENYYPLCDHNYSRSLLNVEGSIKKNLHEDISHIRPGKARISIIMDFLNELKSYPYLWYTELAPLEVYEDGLTKVVDTMNIRWNLSISKDDFPEDIELIKKWYSANSEKRILAPDFKPDYKIFHEKCCKFVKSVKETKSYNKDCDMCPLRFFGEIALQVHKFRTHSVGELPYKCYACGKCFDYVLGLYKHLNNTHKNPVPLKEIQPGQVLNFSKKCTKCSKKCVCVKAFNAHKELHNQSERPPFKCDVCNQTFRTSGLCKGHRKRHFPAPYQCEICPKKYYDAFPFKEHLKMHKGQRDFMCEWCGQIFVRKRSWKEHVAYAHQNLGLCNICGKRLRTALGLFKHLRAFHRPIIGLPEKLHEHLIKCSLERNRRKAKPKNRKSKYKYIIDAVTKRRRICCPDCDKHYFGYDALYSHMKRIHGTEASKRTQNPESKHTVETGGSSSIGISDGTTGEVGKVPNDDNIITDETNNSINWIAEYGRNKTS